MSNNQSNAPSASIIEHRYLPHVLSLVYFLILISISFSYHKIGDYGLETDFYMRYVPNAESFLNGSIVIDGFQGPMYPMLLGLVKSIVGDYMKAGQLINALSVSLFLLAITLVFKRIFSTPIALGIFLITAANKHIIQNTYSCGTDMLFLGLLGGMIYFLLIEQKASWKNIILTGVFAGLTFLTRFNGLFMVLGILFSYTILNIYHVNWKDRLIHSAAVFTLFLGIYSPYGFYTQSEKGSFMFNTNYKNVAWTYQAEGKVTWDEFWHENWCGKNNIHGVTDVVFYDFGAFVSNYFSTLITNLSNDFDQLLGTIDHSSQTAKEETSFYGYLIGIMAIIGLLSYLLNFPKDDRRQIAFIVLNLIFWGVLGLVFYNPRFSMFLIPFYLVMAMRVFELPAIKKAMPSIQTWAIPLISVIFFIISAKDAKSYNTDKISIGPKEMPKLQKWFKRNEPTPKAGDGIFARKPHIAYYTGLKFNMFPVVKSWEEFLSKIKERNIKYIYYGNFEYGHRPQLRILTEPKKVPPPLEFIHMQNIPGQSRQVPGFVYRVNWEKLEAMTKDQ